MGSFPIAAIAVISWSVCGYAAAQAEDRTIRLATLEWPPYTTQQFADGGTSTAVVRAALATVGYKLEVEFFPWKRVLALTRKPSRFDGYFPEYMSDTVARRCLMSDPIGTGPIGFAQSIEHPVVWNTLEDLTPYRIGVVQDYVNTAELDLRIAQRKQAFDPARDDTQNLLKLAAGRISLAVVDQRVFDYLMRHDPQLTAYKDKLAFNSRPLEIKQLFICLRPSARAAHSRSMLNAGLRQLGSTKRQGALPETPAPKP